MALLSFTNAKVSSSLVSKLLFAAGLFASLASQASQISYTCNVVDPTTDTSAVIKSSSTLVVNYEDADGKVTAAQLETTALTLAADSESASQLGVAGAAVQIYGIPQSLILNPGTPARLLTNFDIVFRSDLRPNGSLTRFRSQCSRPF